MKKNITNKNTIKSGNNNIVIQGVEGSIHISNNSTDREEAQDLPSNPDSVALFKIELKELVAKNIEKAFQKLKTHLNSDSSSFDSFIQLKGRYERVMQMKHNGVLDFNTESKELNSISFSFIKLVSSVEEQDLKL